MKNKFILAVISIAFYFCSLSIVSQTKNPSFSGVYPHLAYYNDEGECGTGAVVPWQNDLWFITYAPHRPYGSSDKLYQLSSDLKLTIRPESVGGTPANRMIHKESNQLFIGPYAVDANKKVRTIPYKAAPGRYTGLARHLTSPESKLYIGTMEEGFYEVDVNTLETNTLYEDGNVIQKNKGGGDHASTLLPGYHGKGLYSGQGVMVYANNGEYSDAAMKYFNVESGALAEWDGKDWTLVRRNQFTEVTGPGGIYGNPNPNTDPIWSVGWDYKSILLGVREPGGWTFYRLPKTSNSYDGAHGWNTEWPRIQNIGMENKPDYMMTMHGMFWKFPSSFTKGNSKGIRPKSAYLKVIGDFTRWNDKIVLGCDDSAKAEFLNKRKAKGNIGGPGQSHSNLWFVDENLLNNLGPTTAAGSVWLNEEIEAGSISDMFLFSGWENRTAWIKNDSNNQVEYTFEVDETGNNKWKKLKSIRIEPQSSKFVAFNSNEKGEWIRVKVNKPTKASVSFAFSDNETRKSTPDNIFEGLQNVNNSNKSGALLYGLGENQRKMGLVASDSNGKTIGYYEIDSVMNINPVDNPTAEKFVKEKFKIPTDIITTQKSSVLVVDDKGRRWRLPINGENYDELIKNGELRICREVATERDLFSCYGTFYELPAENADGYAKIRPISSHNYRIHDYASYRGLLILSGLNPNDNVNNEHIVKSSDGKVALWAGVIDDLWKLGKPRGFGGPWKDENVRANIQSDPFLIGHYDKRELTLSHQSNTKLTFHVEIDPTGDGTWMTYKKIEVQPGKESKHVFPKGFEGRWIRFSTDRDATVTTWLVYN